LAAAGCGRGIATAPVEGKVLFQGRPLKFGSVIFQPEAGPPATGNIQPDGTFRLSTFRDGDGAVLGKHQVRITCFESQRPGAQQAVAQQELATGQALIPEKYASFATSELSVEVKAKNEPLVFDLK
jgi:hypothetical protein